MHVCFANNISVYLCGAYHFCAPLLCAGLCSEADVVAALTNTFMLRFQLGLFDPAETQPFWHVNVSNINTPAAQQLNMLATLSSLVLLKNDKGTLPLLKGKKIAVIGPHSLSQEDLAGICDK